MRARGRRIEFIACDPRMDDPGILPGRQVRLRSDPAGKEVPGVPASNVGKPRLDRGSGLLGDLELHRPARLLLNDGRAVTDPTADADIEAKQRGDRRPCRALWPDRRRTLSPGRPSLSVPTGWRPGAARIGLQQARHLPAPPGTRGW